MSTDATPLAALVGRADAIYRDYSLTTVREWKARTGGLAVGFMPIYVPCEILDAQGVLPVGLMGARDDLTRPAPKLVDLQLTEAADGLAALGAGGKAPPQESSPQPMPPAPAHPTIQG